MNFSMVNLLNGAMAVGGFLVNNYLVILIYILIAFIVVKNKHKFHFQSGIIALYKTKLGLKMMDKWGNKHPKFFRFIGYLGVIVGFIGMVFMTFALYQGVSQFYMDPQAPATVGVVIPGIQVEGSPFNSLDIITGLIIIFIVAAFHEFGHGVISRAHNVRVNSSGVVFFGPILGAFVEPDNKQLYSSSNKTQLSIFAAGPFFNVILTLFAMAIITMLPFAGLTFAQNQPLIVDTITDNSTLSQIDIEQGDVIKSINGVEMSNLQILRENLYDLEINESIEIVTNKGEFNAKLMGHPENGAVPFLGITPKQTVTSWLLFKLEIFLMFLAIISIGIGAANLLPFGPLDGGRMIKNVIEQMFAGKTAHIVFSWVSSITLLLLLTNIFWPIIRLFL